MTFVEMDAGTRKVGLRERTRDAVRAQIAEQSLILFDEIGFDETTIDDIAEAVGISSRSFFRYFPAKEDVIVGDPLPLGIRVRDSLAAQPAEVPLWAALRAAFIPLEVITNGAPATGLRVMRVMMSTPSLRARNLEKHIAWGSLLVPVVVDRLPANDPRAELQAQVIVNSAFACLDVAFAHWTASEAEEPLASLLDVAFDTLAPRIP